MDYASPHLVGRQWVSETAIEAREKVKKHNTQQRAREFQTPAEKALNLLQYESVGTILTLTNFSYRTIYLI
ncbi:MAG: hypothetical protein J07HQX50_00233 [Haloquadratum sp. J07HQX50]|jgi:hypothetical protein|nr:MAG: hypothetical protein J07HQX50_00233 [Haloquadratum sp. J07HQX50]